MAGAAHRTPGHRHVSGREVSAAPVTTATRDRRSPGRSARPCRTTPEAVRRRLARVAVGGRAAAAEPRPADPLHLPPAARQHPAVVLRLEHLGPDRELHRLGQLQRVVRPRRHLDHRPQHGDLHGRHRRLARWGSAWPSPCCSTSASAAATWSAPRCSHRSSSPARRSASRSSSSSTPASGWCATCSRGSASRPGLLPEPALGAVHGDGHLHLEEPRVLVRHLPRRTAGPPDRPRRGGRDRRRVGVAKFSRVLLPQLRPTTFFLSITVMLSSVQVFDIINVMTRGGPVGQRHDHDGLPGLPGDLRQPPSRLRRDRRDDHVPRPAHRHRRPGPLHGPEHV